MEPTIGIDLGTSYSSVAVVRNGRPEVLADDEGRKEQPSIIAFLPEGGIAVGYAARARLAIDPFNTIYSAKRLIGRRTDEPEVQVAVQNFPYKVVPGPNNHPIVQVRNERLSIPEVSAYILRTLKKIAENRLGVPVDKAVITVPANFNDAQRESTRIAGRIAGLDVIRVMNEPTAAALAYGYGRGLNKLVAVYDFGGGTLDFTLLEIRGHIFRVISTAGDSFLGGDDFDEALASAVADSFWKQTDVELRRDVVEWQRCLLACEEVKRKLTDEPSAFLNVKQVANTAKGTLDLSATITRELFNSLCYNLIRRSFEVCERALADARVRPEDVDEVLMVGGTTYIPLVRASVEQFFGKQARSDIPPTTAVCLGAAIQAASLMAEPSPDPFSSQTILLDVLPHSIGIVSAGGMIERVLERNMSIPVEQSRLFSTSQDGQTEIKVKIVQGEGKHVQENTPIGELVIRDLRPAPRGTVEVLVTFEVDTNGILNVTARDKDSGRIYRKSVRVSGELDEKAISQLKLRT